MPSSQRRSKNPPSGEAGLKKRFGIVLLWRNDAETETAHRYRRAAERMGIRCDLLDHRGCSLEDGERVTRGQVDFVISTHFVVPKGLDAFSFIQLSCPDEQYRVHPRGYERYTRHLLSYDDFLSCGSVAGDDQVRRSLLRDPLHLPPQLAMYSAAGEPVIEPRAGPRRLCYFRGKWDAPRHRELLQQLDRRGCIELYGNAAGDWSGFDRWRGELPYDGRSVVEKAAEHGAVLVLSSPAHVEDAVMSNRIFEALAAGAVIICDQNPFARKNFGDSLLYIDVQTPDAAERVGEHLDWIDAHPDQATEMAQRAQQIFRKDFSADVCLKRIYDSLDERRKALTFGLDPAADTNPLVRVIYLLTDCSEAGLDALVAACCEQDYRRVQLQVLVEPDPAVEKAVDKRLRSLGADFRVQRVDELVERSTTRMGSVLAEALQAVGEDQFDYLCVMTSAERPFYNQLSSLVRLMQRSPDCTVGATGEVFERPGDYGDEEFNALTAEDNSDFVGDLDVWPVGFARFVLSKPALEDEGLFRLLPHLNRKAMAALTVGRPMARSTLTTVLVDRDAPFFRQPVRSEREDTLIGQLYPDFLDSAAALRDRVDRGVGRQVEQIRELQEGQLAAWHRQRKRNRRQRRRLQGAGLLIAGALLIWLIF